MTGWRLSAPQWDMLTGVLQLEGYPSPIQVPSHGRTALERARIRAQVRDELSRLGLMRGGRVDADLEAAMRLLHRPASWLDSVWLPEAAAQQPVRVLAARDRAVGVCALQYPDSPGATVLDVIPAAGLAAAVVSRLPSHPPGRSTAVTVSAILDQPHERAGQIAANVRDSLGRVRRSQLLCWCDNTDGRYQITIIPRHDDSRSLTVAPADPHRLGEALERLLTTLD